MPVIDLKPGDLVQPTTGGPLRVVVQIDGENVLTRWWDERSREFKKQVLSISNVGPAYAYN